MDDICNAVSLTAVSLPFVTSLGKMVATVEDFCTEAYKENHPKFLKACKIRKVWHCMIVYMPHPIYNTITSCLS